MPVLKSKSIKIPLNCDESKENTISDSEQNKESVKYSVNLIKTINPFNKNVIKYDEDKIIAESNILRIIDLEKKINDSNVNTQNKINKLETKVSKLTKDYNELKLDSLNEITTMRKQIANLLSLVEEIYS